MPPTLRYCLVDLYTSLCDIIYNGAMGNLSLNIYKTTEIWESSYSPTLPKGYPLNNQKFLSNTFRCHLVKVSYTKSNHVSDNNNSDLLFLKPFACPVIRRARKICGRKRRPLFDNQKFN